MPISYNDFMKKTNGGGIMSNRDAYSTIRGFSTDLRTCSSNLFNQLMTARFNNPNIDSDPEYQAGSDFMSLIESLSNNTSMSVIDFGDEASDEQKQIWKDNVDKTISGVSKLLEPDNFKRFMDFATSSDDPDMWSLPGKLQKMIGVLNTSYEAGIDMELLATRTAEYADGLRKQEQPEMQQEEPKKEEPQKEEIEGEPKKEEPQKEEPQVAAPKQKKDSYKAWHPAGDQPDDLKDGIKAIYKETNNKALFASDMNISVSCLMKDNFMRQKNNVKDWLKDSDQLEEFLSEPMYIRPDKQQMTRYEYIQSIKQKTAGTDKPIFQHFDEQLVSFCEHFDIQLDLEKVKSASAIAKQEEPKKEEPKKEEIKQEEPKQQQEEIVENKIFGDGIEKYPVLDAYRKKNDGQSIIISDKKAYGAIREFQSGMGNLSTQDFGALFSFGVENGQGPEYQSWEAYHQVIDSLHSGAILLCVEPKQSSPGEEKQRWEDNAAEVIGNTKKLLEPENFNRFMDAVVNSTDENMKALPNKLQNFIGVLNEHYGAGIDPKLFNDRYAEYGTYRAEKDAQIKAQQEKAAKEKTLKEWDALEAPDEQTKKEAALATQRDEFSKKLDELSKGLHARHRGDLSGLFSGASKEMQELRDAIADYKAFRKNPKDPKFEGKSEIGLIDQIRTKADDYYEAKMTDPKTGETISMDSKSKMGQTRARSAQEISELAKAFEVQVAKDAEKIENENLKKALQADKADEVKEKADENAFQQRKAGLNAPQQEEPGKQQEPEKFEKIDVEPARRYSMRNPKSPDINAPVAQEIPFEQQKLSFADLAAETFLRHFHKQQVDDYMKQNPGTKPEQFSVEKYLSDNKESYMKEDENFLSFMDTIKDQPTLDQMKAKSPDELHQYYASGQFRKQAAPEQELIVENKILGDGMVKPEPTKAARKLKNVIKEGGEIVIDDLDDANLNNVDLEAKIEKAQKQLKEYAAKTKKYPIKNGAQQEYAAIATAHFVRLQQKNGEMLDMSDQGFEDLVKETVNSKPFHAVIRKYDDKEMFNKATRDKGQDMYAALSAARKQYKEHLDAQNNGVQMKKSDPNLQQGGFQKK